jgi:hypothetical protein
MVSRQLGEEFLLVAQGSLIGLAPLFYGNNERT